MLAPAAAPGTHVTRDPVPNTRAPTNRRQSNKLTPTSLSATHVRPAARFALLRPPLARPAPRRQVGPAPGRPAQTPVSETVLWCLRKETRIIIFLTGDERLFQEAEKMGASKYWGPLSCIRVRQFCEQHERRAMGERRLPAPPRMWAGPEGDAAGIASAAGESAVAVGAGPTQTVPSAGWEAGPARRLTRGRSGKASAWRRVRGRACAVRGGRGLGGGWKAGRQPGSKGWGWRPGLAWKLVILVWLEI